MIILLICTIFLVIVLVLFRPAIHEAISRYAVVRILKYVVIVASALWMVFLLYMGIGEVSGGDNSGLAHLITAIPFALVVYLLATEPPARPRRKH